MDDQNACYSLRFIDLDDPSHLITLFKLINVKYTGANYTISYIDLDDISYNIKELAQKFIENKIPFRLFKRKHGYRHIMYVSYKNGIAFHAKDVDDIVEWKKQAINVKQKLEIIHNV